ncbi:MAG: TerC family protein [Proteobacteria bacterium]|nr:TerC family protein [Pseudomonadota bacterium]
MSALSALVTSPEAWIALLTLVVMEVVLGVDNLVFVALVSGRLPAERQGAARRLGIGLALVLRLMLLSVIAFIVGLTRPVLTLPFPVPSLEDGHPMVDLAFSWRDLILLAGGLFLVWKATSEIHHTMNPEPSDELLDKKKGRASLSFGAAIFQILALDLVFSIDSILTAVGMTEHLPIMMAAVVIAVGLMLVASGPLARFIHANPGVVMLALGFLLLIGATLIAEGFGVHVPKGYIYAAMAFAGVVEALNMTARKRRKPPSHPPSDRTLH